MNTIYQNLDRTRRTLKFSVMAMIGIGWLSLDSRSGSIAQERTDGVTIQHDDLAAHHEELATTINDAPTKYMTQGGLVGVMGGTNVRLMKEGAHEIFLPLPQLTHSQVPLNYFIRAEPADAVIDYRLQQRDGGNVVVSIRLEGDRNQEVSFEWSSLVLVDDRRRVGEEDDPRDFLIATPCVQANDERITEIAARLWSDNDNASDFAEGIQDFVRAMERKSQPRSLDALGILDSGVNGICTANSNLAIALLRSREIPSRSLAVIPPISQKLEMHRIVEYHDGENWLTFDPSSVQAGSSLQPWQNIIVATTSIADEELSMKPRMGSAIGCPYGQEIELISDGITIWGQDFFWTIAKPLAEFDVDGPLVEITTEAWQGYLEEGELSEGQIGASRSTDADELRAWFNHE